MDKRLLALPLLLLAGTSLSGCVAAAIPALAGAGMIGTRVDGKDAGEGKEAAKGTVEVARPATVDAPTPVAAAPAPAPVKPQAVPAPSIAVVTAPAIMVPPPAQPAPKPAVVPAPAPAPQIIAAPNVPAQPPRVPAPAPAPAPTVAPAPAPPAMIAVVPNMVPPPSGLREARAYPDPSNPISPDRFSFARFVRHAQAAALGAKGGADPLSAILSDPLALDGKRRRCSAGEQQVVVIDLDPAGGLFSPPANPAKQPGLAIGLAVLREAGVEIAWLSDMPVNESGSLRSALELSGLDPRGQDIISLRRDEADNKQQRRQNLAGIACIIAIAGDERPDFDERFKYLRNAEAGAGIEPVIGDGWFLIEPLLGE